MTSIVRYTNRVCEERHEVLRVFEAPLTDEQPLELPPNQLFWIERRIPCLEEDVSKHDIADVQIGRLFLVAVRGQR